MDKLLYEVKPYIHVTWDDEDIEINSLILEAKQYLSEKVGTEIDYEKDLVAKGLLNGYTGSQFMCTIMDHLGHTKKYGA